MVYIYKKIVNGKEYYYLRASETKGKKTIVKWKTEGLSLGQAATGEVKALVLRFSTDTLPDTKQGKSGVFDFVFSSAGL